MAHRERALQAGSWVLALGVLVGVGALGYRGWKAEKERDLQEEEAARARAVTTVVDAGTVKPAAELALQRCLEAIARSYALGGWKATQAVCREAEQEAGGDARLIALNAALRCHEWKVRVGLEQTFGDEPPRAADARLEMELRAWIRDECAPETSLQALAPAMPAEAQCDLQLDQVTLGKDRALGQFMRLREYSPACADSERGKVLHAELKAEGAETAARFCGRLSDSLGNEYSLRFCRTYVELKYCPDLTAVQPPQGKTLQLDGTLKGKGWRPEDPVVVLMLRSLPAESRTGWSCSEDGKLVVPEPRSAPRPTGPNRMPLRK